MPTVIPTLYLCHAGARPPERGPGRLLHAMAFPPDFVREHSGGRVPALTPVLSDRRAFRNGQIKADEYRTRFELRFAGHRQLDRYRPGALVGLDHQDRQIVLVDGDSVVCTCSSELALKDACHRAWVAPHLRRAGWRVLLDGREVGDGPPAPTLPFSVDRLREVAREPHEAGENFAATGAQDLLDAAEIVRLGDVRADRAEVLDRVEFRREVEVALAEGFAEATHLPRVADLCEAHARSPDADPLVEAIAPLLRTAARAMAGEPGAGELLREQVADFTDGVEE